MRSTGSRVALAALLVSLGPIASLVPAEAGVLMVAAEAVSPTQVEVGWTFYETPGSPAGHPEWVGYDVWRSESAMCGMSERVNAEIIPRVVGATHSASFLDTPPVPNATWEYSVRPVDASRQRVWMGYPDCDPPCPPQAFAACPAFSAPLAVGTAIEMGWAVMVQPCEETCWPAVYVENPAADALRPYAGTSQPIAVYGTTGCGTVEGCALTLHHVELGSCGATPARRPTWGGLKSIYR